MRILSARVSGTRVLRDAARVETVVVLTVDHGPAGLSNVCVPVSAPIVAPGGARLKQRLIASAKLIFAMAADDTALPEAEVARRAA
jgi:hypothetical protein